jgi:hypothetical protein
LHFGEHDAVIGTCETQVRNGHEPYWHAASGSAVEVSFTTDCTHCAVPFTTTGPLSDGKIASLNAKLTVPLPLAHTENVYPWLAACV